MQKNKGYIGFVLLLVTVGIIGFMMWRTDLFTTGEVLTLDENGKPVKTVTDQVNSIKKARDAKLMLESEVLDK